MQSTNAASGLSHLLKEETALKNNLERPSWRIRRSDSGTICIEAQRLPSSRIFRTVVTFECLRHRAAGTAVDMNAAMIYAPGLSPHARYLLRRLHHRPLGSRYTAL